ncbi:MAG TPA: cytochrome c oxidase subunit 3 [Flavipsychrobacter sp.]|nr:cytochrome c oxidase subunit 3 [Flavipsychrobacter sp.]
MEGVMSTDQRKRIHPQKFAMWVALGSIAMMFAGLTSAYVVKQASGNWRSYHLPDVFWISTIAIVLSSVTIVLGIRAFKRREIPKYKMLITATLILGVAFGVLQFAGFYQLYAQPQELILNGESLNRLEAVTVAGNPAESFLFVIAGLHLLHILGGIVALAIVFFKAFRKRVKIYNATGLEIVATYWHFVDVLWIYLFMFFLANQ